jgi:hypothetical protein
LFEVWATLWQKEEPSMAEDGKLKGNVLPSPELFMVAFVERCIGFSWMVCAS